MTPVGDQAHTPRRTGVGRRSTLGLYEPLIDRLLREDPDLSTAGILNLLRRAGYAGGKTALYELVRRLRLLASG
jgi:hypothetical protein